MTRIFRGDQQGDLWVKARVGRITGSRIDDLLAPPTIRQSTRKGVVYPAGSEAQCKEDYRHDLVIERIYGQAVNHPTNKYMQDGIDREPAARLMYEAENGTPVEPVSFCLHHKWDWCGVSPDGLVSDDGGLELKCPSESVHDAYARNLDLLVEQYKGQCLMGLICLPERQWWDLQSFNPYAPREIMLLKTPRFHRSDWAKTIARIEDEAQQMNAQVEAEIAKRGLPPTQWRVMP